jgi:hypothetical protein
MLIFVVTPVAIMEDISISDEQAAYIFRVEARHKCRGLDT